MVRVTVYPPAIPVYWTNSKVSIHNSSSAVGIEAQSIVIVASVPIAVKSKTV
ncbi:hypothetical protein ES708_10721 [subsurface metagenome]